MKKRLASKHQKLILQCYPPGKVGEKRPNASELSYLLYYVSTRRAKLSKVGVYLEQKNGTDLYRQRSGNVAVTLEITKSLISRCYEDLNLFADHVIAILYQVLQSGDLALCEHAVEVFSVFCRHHEKALFSGDIKYATSFCDLVQKMVKVSSTTEGPNVLQWNRLGMQGARSVGRSEIITVPTSDQLIKLLVGFVLDTLTVDEEGAVLSDVKQKLDQQEAQKREGARTSVSEEASEEQRLQLLAGDALRTFFDTVDETQLRSATKYTIKWMTRKPLPKVWCSTLITTATRWVPVQLRFVVLQALVDLFGGLNMGEIEKQNTLAHLINSLLGSNVSLGGLSVIDILRKLNAKQHDILRHDDSAPAKKLVETLTGCISSIATHIYYADQIPNMVAELLFKSRHDFGTVRNSSSVNLHNAANSDAPAAGDSRSVDVILADLEDVQTILNTASSHSNEMNKVPLQAWEGSQYLLTHENRRVREAFACAFVTYLNYSVAEKDKHLKLHKNFHATHGTLGRLILNAYQAAVSKNAQRPDYITTAHLLVGMVQSLGVNAAARVLPFAMMMQNLATVIEHQEDGDKGYELEQGVALGCISLLTFDAISKLLGLDNLNAAVQQRVEARTNNETWYQPLDSPLRLGLPRDLTQKKGLNFIPADAERTRQTVPITADDMKSLVVIQDFPEDLAHVLFDEVSLNDEAAGTDTGTESVHGDIVVNQARSLKQLQRNYASTTQSQENNNGTNLSRHNTVGAGGFLGRDFSPDVSQLKRAASGILKPDGNGFMQSARARQASAATSAAVSITSSFSTAEESTSQMPRHEYNEQLDIDSFLSGMTIHSAHERGKLM